MQDALEIVLGLFAVAFFATLYMAPTLIAFNRSESSGRNGVLLVNLFLGWSGIGWLGALIWAVSLPATVRTILQDPVPSSSETRRPRPIEQVERDERGRIVID